MGTHTPQITPLRMRFLLSLSLFFALAASATAQSARPSAALDHLRQQAPALGLGAADLADLAVTDATVSRRSGATHVYLRQRLGGLDVIGSEVTVSLDRSGTALHTAGAPLPDLAKRVTSRRALLTAEAAVRRAGEHAGVAAPDGMLVANAKPGPARATTFAPQGEAAEPVEARLVYHADKRGTLRQAWEVSLPTADRQHVWLTYVDAATGAELARHDLVVHDFFGHTGPGRADGQPGSRTAPDYASGTASGYRVYAAPVESPSHGARSLVTAPAPAASPFGWHDTDGAPGADYTITRGNNVHAYRDADGDGTPEAGESPDGGTALAFDFPADLSQVPSAYADAAVTNLFYWTNLLHDVLYGYGFDEAAGNFQANTYGRGGLGGDAVRAEAQDGSGVNNATFYTPADGRSPRMQMHLWNHTAPGRDGSFDSGIIIHEYVHGLSNRLTGGPTATACLVGQEQPGEGWSDFYALMLTLDADDAGADRRGIGTYVKGQTADGDGIRPTPYSTSFAVNNVTYGDLGSQAVPHGVGYVWATMLWEAAWELIGRHGFSPDVRDAGGSAGNQIMLNLVTEAMKMQPCNPGFVEARDAILAADRALYGGAHAADLWRAFARRGLGLHADQGSASVVGDETDDFTEPGPPPVALLHAASLSASALAGEHATAAVSLSNAASAGGRPLVFSAAVVEAVPAGAGAKAAAPSPFNGADAFGYTWTDAATPGGPAVAFHDISATGSALVFTPTSGYPAADEGYADVVLPFAFPFYGTDRQRLRVFSNGFASFSAFAANSYENGTLPEANAPDALIAPLWDDLDTSTGAVYAETLADGRFVVQWDGVGRYDQPGSALTFELILAPDGTVEFQYVGLSGALSADAGIESDDGTVGLSTTAGVAGHSAVRIVPPLAWASVAPASGSVVPGGSASFTLTLDATGLDAGRHHARLVVLTNDPARPTLTVPVDFTVDAGGLVSVTAARTSGPAVPAGGGTVAYDLTFTNPSGTAFEGQVWVFATLPNGRRFGPIYGPAALSLGGGEARVESITSRVPARAPAGAYTVTATLGAAFPDDVADTSSFTFSKSGSAAVHASREAATWTTENLTRGTTASATLAASDLPAEAELLGAYPNPLRERAAVRFALAADAEVRLEVFDLLGRRVALLAEGLLEAGIHEAAFDGSPLPSGVYLVRFDAGDTVQTQRVTLLH